MTVFHCVRVYGNGSSKEAHRDAKGRDSWLEYNKTYRPGCALFVDGEYQEDTGVFVAGISDDLAAQIREQYPNGSPRAVADQIGPQIDVWFASVDHRVGYPDDHEGSRYRTDY